MMDLLDIPMPFSAVLKQEVGTPNLQIGEGHRNSASSIYLDVPSGVSTIQYTWDGEVAVELCYSDDSGGSQRSGVRIEHQPGGGQRAARPIQLPLAGSGPRIYFRLDAGPTEADVAASYKLGVIVIPISTP